MKKIFFCFLTASILLYAYGVFAGVMTPATIKTMAGKYLAKHIDQWTKEVSFGNIPEDSSMRKCLFSPTHLVGQEDNCQILFTAYDGAKVTFERKGELYFELKRDPGFEEKVRPDGLMISRSQGPGHFTYLEFYSGYLRINMADSRAGMIEILLGNDKVIAKGKGVFEIFLENNKPKIHIISGNFEWNHQGKAYL